MSPSPGTHASASRQQQPAHEGGPAAFSFIKSRPGGCPDDLWDCALSPGCRCPAGRGARAPRTPPARPEAAGDGEGRRVIKRLAHYGRTGSGSGRELPPNPGETRRKLELA